MKHSILIYLIIIPAFCYCQKRENKDLKKYVDSIIDKRSKQNLYDLHECDTVLALMNYPQEYKYWNYYYHLLIYQKMINSFETHLKYFLQLE